MDRKKQWLGGWVTLGQEAAQKETEGNIVEGTIKAVIETADGVHLQVSFDNETALIYRWQIVSSDA
jgi:hypothetical protein